MSDESLDKQHQATGKKLADLRRKGKTMRSKDLTSGLVFASTIIMLIFMAHSFKLQLESNFYDFFNLIKDVLRNDEFPSPYLKKIIINNFVLLLPIFFMAILAAFSSPFLFGGWNFSSESIGFKWESLNPINNLKNMFSKKMILNVVKSSLKVTVIIGVLIVFTYNNRFNIIELTNLPMQSAFYGAYYIIANFIVVCSASLIFIILYDVVASYFEYQQKVKMTTQELKDEMKETEGNAQVKRKIRSAQFAVLRQRLGSTVPTASVIITNPTHYAVAVKYNPEQDHAPKIVAKGKGLIAQHIRKIAITNGIPLYEAPLLARAVYNTTKIGSEIQPELYMSVALVLSYVHQLKNYQQGQGQMPQFVSDLPIPNEFIYHE